MCSASQPSSRAMRGGDAQREALLAQQRVAAVAAAVATRSRAPRGSGRCTSARGCRARRRPAAPAPSGMPTECRQRHEVAVAQRVEHRAPMRVMIRMLTTTYGESVISTPIWAMGEPIGPMLNGIDVHRAAPHASRRRAAEHPHFISSGSIQLLVGPASFFCLRADERPVLDARDVARIGRAQR